MKKILIIGPIGDFGGREIEANLIARSLSNNYQIQLISTTYITKNSQALINLNSKPISLDSILYKKNSFFKILSIFSKFYNKGKKRNSAYINNAYSKKIGLNKKYTSVLESLIKKQDAVFICAQISSNHIKKIITIAKNYNKKIYFRTTGTLKIADIEPYGFLNDVDLFIHHSKKNANILYEKLNVPFVIIDQCTLAEDKLLEIPINNTKDKINFGFLGRFDEEKGIIPLVDFFLKNKETLYIAGSGKEEVALLKKIDDNKNCIFLGEFKSYKIHEFFDQIDVLIIPSLEEAGPLVGIEAMAAGKIIISTKVGAMEERLLLTKNNFWFDINKEITLNQEISKINSLKIDEKNKISISLRDKYKLNHSLSKIFSEYNKIMNL